ncbi:MAG: hypothetical protein MUF34_11550 [Polyangiaceae bacterium]|nr:hypothetical protein [Polyangiaceae bacterium]
MKRFVSSVVCALAFTAVAGAAHADSKCSNFDIIVENNFVSGGLGREIKVIDMEYFDNEDGKWRSEVTGNETINPGSSETWTKNLEYVGGESGVIVKIHYKAFVNGAWTSTLFENSSSFQCVDNGFVRVTVE